ncbi:MAG: TraR/DksA family transcriptional regulator [Bacteroidia bacterium]|nr:TraR/DksA family transcriptional regulator [Bacteroidia bacterium]MBL4715620.1 TraR/DksA family transcriptional regulator [Bacteroidia bacterium]
MTKKKTASKRTSKKTSKSTYNDKELDEFKELILKKMESAKNELQYLQDQISSANSHGTSDTAATFKVLEDGASTLEKEQLNQMAARQQKFIRNLEDALVRIQNKTYGICKTSGKLISKERLKAVPHTTMSIAAKLKQYN